MTNHTKEADIVNTDRNSVWHHLTQHKPLEEADPLVIVAGKGMRVTDARGNEYLDATSGGLWTVNVGYGRERIADAVREQLVEMCYFSNTAGSVPGALFAEKLLEKMPGLGRVYLSSSGSEANEKAYKMVRQLAHINGDGSKHKIIFRDRDYHGTTIAALSSTGQFERKNQYGPFVPGFSEFSHCCCYRCPFGKEYGDCNIECARDLETAILREGPESVGAVVLEPITAGGGVIEPVPEYFPIIQEICRKYEVLLHLDEVVCGLGRTGKWFGYQHFGVQPDMVTMAKGVASGYAAISCTVTTDAIFQQFKADPAERMRYFRDVSTFAGCTSGPVAGLETICIIEEEGLLDNVVRMGDHLMDRLLELKEQHSMIGDVRGKGLFAGLELVADRQSKHPAEESYAIKIVGPCLSQGVMIGRTNRSFREFNNTLCLSPALIAGRRDIDDIVDAIDCALTANPL
ncbi:MAG: aminotransferase class III-fold pyridoxal phosphate-dependent enzyme [Gammaproteobacteria bacterium]|nr:aminotransferase class III-fold pyridoxal phosphate-dependent enzyme [Gammaproteobacteria bacterium]